MNIVDEEFVESDDNYLKFKNIYVCKIQTLASYVV